MKRYLFSLSLLLTFLVGTFVSLIPAHIANAEAEFNYSIGSSGAPSGILISDGGIFTIVNGDLSGTSFDTVIGNCQIDISVNGKMAGSGKLIINTTGNGPATQNVKNCQFDAQLPSFDSQFPSTNTYYNINVGKEIQQTGAWLDHSEIDVSIGGTSYTFLDNKIDDKLNFAIQGASDKCTSQDFINGFHHQYGIDFGNASDSPAAVITMYYSGTSQDANCIPVAYPISFTAQDNYNDYFAWQDSATITTSDQTSIIYVQNNSGGPFIDNGRGSSANSSCQSKNQIIVSGPGATTGTLKLVGTSSTYSALHEGWPGPNPGKTNEIYNAPLHADGLGCYVSNDIPILIANPHGRASNAPGSSQNLNPTSVTPALKCNFFSFNPLNWFICPVIDGIQHIMNYVGSVIQSYLIVPDKFFDTGTSYGQAVYQAWSSVRDIALAGIAIAALVMVASQALSFGPFDNYTVKKILPRILIGAVLITVSWPLIGLMVALSNGLGEGVRGLIYAPFSNLPGLNPNSTTLGAGLLGGLGLGTAFGIFGVLSFGLSAAIALLTGLAVLVLRQLAVILLAIFAPIAIIAYILPGTDKVWDLWFDSFSGALLMFPLIEALIAIGAVFSKIATLSGGTINQIIAFVAIYLPYFLLPATVRFAGGFIQAVGGRLHEGSQGLHGRVQKFRQQRAAENMGKLKTGSRFQERRFTGAKQFNRLTQGLATGSRGQFGIGARGRAAMDISTRAAAAESMKDPKMNQLQFDDDGILAMSLSAGSSAQSKIAMTKLFQNPDGTWKKGWSEARVDKAVATANSVGINRANSTAALDMMARNKSFSLPGGAEGMDAIIDATNRLGGGNKALADNLMGSFEFNSRQAGRFDLGMHDYEHGTSDLEGAWKKANLYQHATGTGASMKAFTDHWEKVYQEGLDTGDMDKIRQGRIAFHELGAILPNATADNQNIINESRARLELMQKDQDDYINTLSPADRDNAARNLDIVERAARAQARTYERENMDRIIGGAAGGGGGAAGGAP